MRGRWFTLAFSLFFLVSCGLPIPNFALKGHAPLKHPIVLVHGATTKGSRLQIGFLDFGDYFRGIQKFYATTGTPVFTIELSTDASIGERATVLKNLLETDFRGQKVNLIGHSLGGLDIRYAASVLNVKEIASVTTIGTPHRGTPLADWAVRQMKEGTGWYWMFRVLGYDLRGRRFLTEISTGFMRDVFNPKVPNRPDVKYFSVSSSARFSDGTMSYLLWFPARWLEGEGNELSAHGHDGLVPLDSQSWGTEIYRATLDHLGQMNHHEWRERDEESAALDLYARIYANLERAGL